MPSSSVPGHREGQRLGGERLGRRAPRYLRLSSGRRNGACGGLACLALEAHGKHTRGPSDPGVVTQRDLPGIAMHTGTGDIFPWRCHMLLPCDYIAPGPGAGGGVNRPRPRQVWRVLSLTLVEVPSFVVNRVLFDALVADLP